VKASSADDATMELFKPEAIVLAMLLFS